MPKLVAFKGYNGRYLKASMIEGHEYLEFSSDDSNEEAACFEVIMHPDGHLRIKSKYFGKFWRRSPDWIWADSTNTYEISNDTLFWPVLFVDNDPKDEDKKNCKTSSFFEMRVTTESVQVLAPREKKDCLNAAATTAIKETKLTIEELVSQRDIFNVNYHLKDARIYDEQATIVGAGSADNDTDKETTLTLKVGYETSTSKSFTYNLSIMAGVCTAFTAGIPCIAEGKIEVSVEVTNSFEWNTTDTKTKKAEAEYGVTVPPRSKVLVNYVATEGKCDVPFSYTQRDKLSTDGSFITAEHVDGIYTGSNYYNFHFEQHQPRRL